MDINETYLDIIEAYVSCKSITQIAKVSEERVRRTLITEDLWTGQASASPSDYSAESEHDLKCAQSSQVFVWSSLIRRSAQSLNPLN